MVADAIAANPAAATTAADSCSSVHFVQGVREHLESVAEDQVEKKPLVVRLVQRVIPATWRAQYEPQVTAVPAPRS